MVVFILTSSLLFFRFRASFAPKPAWACATETGPQLGTPWRLASTQHWQHTSLGQIWRGSWPSPTSSTSNANCSTIFWSWRFELFLCMGRGQSGITFDFLVNVSVFTRTLVLCSQGTSPALFGSVFCGVEAECRIAGMHIFMSYLPCCCFGAAQWWDALEKDNRGGEQSVATLPRQVCLSPPEKTVPWRTGGYSLPKALHLRSFPLCFTTLNISAA